MLPLLVLLVFGIIEMAFLVRDHVVVTSDVRVGARLASTAAGAGPATCPTGPDAPPCTPQTAPALAQLAADGIQRAGSAMPVDNIDYIMVYQANAQGYPGADGTTSMPSSCSGVADCVMFTWNKTSNAFRYAGGVWDSASISACFPGSQLNPLDRVGVYLHATHKMLTGLFGRSIGMSDRAVMDFEPLATQVCGARQHS